MRMRMWVAAAAVLMLAGCGSLQHVTDPPRADVPEPATAPPLTHSPAGVVVRMPGSPEGLAVDAADRVIAVGLRSPDGVGLVNTVTGRVRKVVRLSGAPRHLQLGGSAVLVPSEQTDQLIQIALPGGAVIASTKVGHQPHDATYARGTIFVGNEYSNTVSLIRDGKQVAVEPGPLQPGGVAAALDGSVVVVVGVRGRRIEAYSAAGRPLGSASCGIGPTHVRAGPHGLFYVADTEGNQVIIYTVGAHGPRQIGAIPTVTGTPYGIAVDPVRGIVYVTLTRTNLLESFRIDGRALIPGKTWHTVRQPNDVAVDDATGRVYVAGRDSDQLEMITP